MNNAAASEKRDQTNDSTHNQYDDGGRGQILLQKQIMLEQGYGDENGNGSDSQCGHLKIQQNEISRYTKIILSKHITYQENQVAQKQQITSSVSRKRHISLFASETKMMQKRNEFRYKNYRSNVLSFMVSSLDSTVEIIINISIKIMKVHFYLPRDLSIVK